AGVDLVLGTAQGEVLKCQPQWLGVCELALEQVEAHLKRRQLVVGEVDRWQEVVLLSEVVQLLAGELVAAGGDRHAKALELGAVGVVAACERLVAHVRVALDVVLDVAGGDRPLFRHQVSDERELADELVGVVSQSRDAVYRGGAVPGSTLGHDSAPGYARRRAGASRSGRLLRRGGVASPPGAARPAVGGGRRPAQPWRRRDRELRGAQVRNPFRDELLG